MSAQEQNSLSGGSQVGSSFSLTSSVLKALVDIDCEQEPKTTNKKGKGMVNVKNNTSKSTGFSIFEANKNSTSNNLSD